MFKLHRRHLLAGCAFLVFDRATGRANVIQGGVPWKANAATPPEPVVFDGWHFFSNSEARLVEALADRIIPPDSETPGGKDVGCAVYIDRQLAGPFGRADGQYLERPFKKGTKAQGPQSFLNPSQQYRKALAAIEAYCNSHFDKRSFVALSDADKDKVVAALEKGDLPIPDVEPKAFFTVLIKNMREGFFADPIYGGNRDMAGWKMIGFPGARYDYLDWIERHNEPYPHGPVAIGGAPSWMPR